MENDKGKLGTRYRTQYRNDYLYVIVVPIKRELFISSADQDQDPLTGAGLDAMSRMVTLAWKKSSKQEVIKQLKKASRIRADLPGILSEILDGEVEIYDICNDQVGERI